MTFFGFGGNGQGSGWFFIEIFRVLAWRFLRVFMNVCGGFFTNTQALPCAIEDALSGLFVVVFTGFMNVCGGFLRIHRALPCAIGDALSGLFVVVFTGFYECLWRFFTNTQGVALCYWRRPFRAVCGGFYGFL